MTKFLQELEKKILILDGAMGTMIQAYSLEEDDFRGGIFGEAKKPLKGNNDVLSMTRPDVIKEIHYKYLEAGADIIETNTLNSNSISQADYGLEAYVYEMNKASARVAREAVEEWESASQKNRPRDEEVGEEANEEVGEMHQKNRPHEVKFIAGSIGPSTKLLSMSPDVSNPGYRSVSFDELESAFREQIRGLIDGGVDLLLIETSIDSLNVRAALVAAENVYEEKGVRLPIMISGTITDKSGRILSGQTVEAFFHSVKSQDVVAMGLNCSFGAKELIPFIQRISDELDCFISVYPNAGFRNIMGDFDEEPKTTASLLEELIDGGNVNIVGGCCGTTPEHIREIAKVAREKEPRKVQVKLKKTIVCGLEPLAIDKQNNFINIGERTNVAGSRKFARLIREGNYENALDIAREQVENGAQIIDINFDDGMLDSKKEMEKFLKLVAQEPEISKVPIMIDSSDWDVLVTGLKSIQGKHIVNSISLKEGKEAFVKRAKLIKKFGASVVVMAFDEKGQADTFQRKIEVCKRAYEILTKEVDFSPEDIIFDPNILAIATGLDEHKDYAVDYIEAVRWIKQNLPHAKTSGGLSNLSFAFRGNNGVREMMHSVFLYHAIKAGLDMGILNPGMIRIYEDIDIDERNLIEDVVLNRREDAQEDLVEFASRVIREEKAAPEKVLEWRGNSLKERLVHSILKGITEFVDEDINEAIDAYPSALAVVEGPLMDGMNKVGELFGDGKMFLPQVIKSARVMKKSVEILTPVIEKQNANLSGTKNGKVLLATVKGDVHDIGKNIVGVVLSCNNFDVVDMGIMVPPEDILNKAKEINADIIGLSGLITPSLEEMIHVARMMEKDGFDKPLIIGGATTSKVHTAVKIEPLYRNGVVYAKDASKAVEVCKRLMADKNSYLESIKSEYEEVRKTYQGVVRKHISIKEAREKAPVFTFLHCEEMPNFIGVKVINDYLIEEVRKYIDWTFFFVALDMRKKYPEILEDKTYGEEAKKLFKEANELLDEIEKDKSLTLNAVFGIFPANSKGDDIIIFEDDIREKERLRFNMLRRQEVLKGQPYVSLADYIAPLDSGVKDYMGAFTVTGGIGANELAMKYENEGDSFKAILVKILADRLAEAFAEKLHKMVRKEIWGYAKDENLNLEESFQAKYRGIRPAIGYPSIPDHSEKGKLNELLDFENNIGVRLTKSYMMDPVASVSGLYFAHPEIKYFDVGKVFPDQIEDYTKRKGGTDEIIKATLGARVEG